MRLSPDKVHSLKVLLKEHCDLDYTEEEVQQAGLAIIRFAVAKQLRTRELKMNEDETNAIQQRTELGTA